MIPKIIHQTYKIKELPESYQKYQQTLLSLHKDWEYKLWTDQDNEYFLKNNYPEYFTIYNKLPAKIMKFDFIRYVYLYHFGGLYLDLDYEFLKTFDLINYSIVLPRESNDSESIYLGNSILASEPKHFFWENAINTLSKRIIKLSGYIDEETVINTTGPGLITDVYFSLKSKSDIYIPPRLYFNPPIPSNKDEYTTLIHNGLSYGIHHCYGSWRALSFSKRFFNKIKKLFSKLKEIM